MTAPVHSDFTLPNADNVESRTNSPVILSTMARPTVTLTLTGDLDGDVPIRNLSPDIAFGTLATIANEVGRFHAGAFNHLRRTIYWLADIRTDTTLRSAGTCLYAAFARQVYYATGTGGPYTLRKFTVTGVLDESAMTWNNAPGTPDPANETIFAAPA